ncbi:MAG: hypothetical protein LUQ04_11225, partial [Methanoregula sp.]|nr:hypothetical protein [Methanoregula sp.]
MKTKISISVSVVFLVTIMAVFPSSSPGQAFWYGDDISENISAADGAALHDYLVDFVGKLKMMNTNNNPDGIKYLRIYEPKETWAGYTLLSAIGSPDEPNAVLIDMDGTVVKTWSTAMMGVPSKMLPNGDILVGKAPPDMEGTLTQLDWCGNVINSWGDHVHHDFEREGNPVGYYAPGQKPQTRSGKTMWMDHHQITEDTSHISDIPLLDDVIYIANWDGSLDFEWYAWQHFDENDCKNEDGQRRPGCLTMGFDAAAKDAIRKVKIPWMGFPDATDWTHGNQASWVGPNKWWNSGKGRCRGERDLRFHPENIMVDFRNMNLSVIIARYDHPEGKWRSGDIVYRIGPDYSADKPEYSLGTIIGQHHFHMIPQGLPGAGNILIFDNGGNAGFGSLVRGLTDAAGNPIGHYPNTFRNYSRVIEFNPITLEIVWEYEDTVAEGDVDGDGEVKGAERKFFSNLMSSAQRLKNGNTLITESGTSRIFEVTPQGKIVWEYIHPGAGFFGGVYRAYRVPYDWAP